MRRSIEIPGIVWTVALVGLPMAAVWLEQFFGDTSWALPVAGLVLIVAKIAQVYLGGGVDVGGDDDDDDEEDGLPMGVAGATMPPLHVQEEPSKTRRLLWG